MTRLELLSGVSLWLGASLLLAQLRPIGRLRLADRLRPHTVEGSGPATPDRLGARQVIAPMAIRVGRRLSGVVGAADEAELRLARIHSDLGISGFRMRQLAWAMTAAVAAAAVGAVVGLPTAAVLLLLPAGALGSYGLTEWNLGRTCRQYEDRRVLELPVMAEQLAMLVAAGHSLGSALARVASRGRGVVAKDIARVHSRIRQGVPEREALVEWATLVQSASVDRLVAVLALSTETGDLGRLLEQEARAIRRSVQRRTVELMDRRAQQVWIPVTVAALVPGVIFLAVPFVDALRLFAAG